jgi:hypothetical protein
VRRATFNRGMPSQYWTRRCLARDPVTGAWCHKTPTDGAFCAPHGLEFRCDEAAKAATRLARARLVLEDPSASPWRRRMAAWQVRRALVLRRHLMTAIGDAEATGTGRQGDRDLLMPAQGDEGWR